jgi:hypothetical protein
MAASYSDGKIGRTLILRRQHISCYCLELLKPLFERALCAGKSLVRAVMDNITIEEAMTALDSPKLFHRPTSRNLVPQQPTYLLSNTSTPSKTILHAISGLDSYFEFTSPQKRLSSRGGVPRVSFNPALTVGDIKKAMFFSPSCGELIDIISTDLIPFYL